MTELTELTELRKRRKQVFIKLSDKGVFILRYMSEVDNEAFVTNDSVTWLYNKNRVFVAKVNGKTFASLKVNGYFVKNSFAR